MLFSVTDSQCREQVWYVLKKPGYPLLELNEWLRVINGPFLTQAS
jgi:hypothetical protein